MHNSLEYAQYKAQRIKELVPECNAQNFRILDFGCGNGLMTYYLQEVFFQATVIGIDQSESAIQDARKEYPAITFEHLKNNKLDFSNNYFDLIIAADVFHHISFEQHNYWIEELMRILKPRGFFMLLELNPLNFFTYWEFKKNSYEKDAQMLWPWSTKKLLRSFGKTQLYFCNFSNWLELNLNTSLLKRIPFGRTYIACCKKF